MGAAPTSVRFALRHSSSTTQHSRHHRVSVESAWKSRSIAANMPVRCCSPAVSPSLHYDKQPVPQVAKLYLFQLFAEVFRPLPYIGNLFRIIPDSGWPNSQASVMSKGLDIFRWLFPSSTPGIETTQALTDDTPLTSMISECVNVEASFDDSIALSRAQVCPDLPDVALLPRGKPGSSG